MSLEDHSLTRTDATEGKGLLKRMDHLIVFAALREVIGAAELFFQPRCTLRGADSIEMNGADGFRYVRSNLDLMRSVMEVIDNEIQGV